MKIAVVGGGVSGLLVARQLATEHDVHLFESGSRIGGHAQTTTVDVGGRLERFDTGFLVFNDRTYPCFSGLLRELGVPTHEIDVSFLVRSEEDDTVYAGGSIRDLLAVRSHLLSPSFHVMVRDIIRFGRQIKSGADRSNHPLTIDEFLTQKRYGRAFVDQFLLPLTRAVWPCSRKEILETPAACLISLCRNYGLSGLRERCVCRTVADGAEAYISKLTEGFRNRIHVDCPVASIHRCPQSVLLKFRHQPRLRFDCVVIATHADQALALLADASRLERQLLGAFEYRRQEALLHVDSSLMSSRSPSSVAWQYELPTDADAAVSLTYNLSYLQRASHTKTLYLTLNAGSRIPTAKVFGQFSHRRPIFSVRSLQAQKRWREINGPSRTYFAGAYWGHGFHEDAVRSALATAERIRASDYRA